MAKYIFRDQTITNNQTILWSSLSGLDANYTLIPYVSLKNVSSGEANAIERRSTYFKISLSGFTASPVICNIEVDVGYPSEITRGMITNDMLDLFLLYVGDPKGAFFKPQQVVQLLNDSALSLVGELDAEFFPELMVTLSGETVNATGGIDTSAFTYKIFNGFEGLMDDGVYVDGYYAREKSKYTYKERKNLGRNYDHADKPIYYKDGDYIYLEPYKASTTQATLHYLRNPYVMTLADSDNNVNCDLHSKWHNVIVGDACEVAINGYLVVDGKGNEKLVRPPQALIMYNRARKLINIAKSKSTTKISDTFDPGFRDSNVYNVYTGV